MHDLDSPQKKSFHFLRLFFTFPASYNLPMMLLFVSFSVKAQSNYTVRINQTFDHDSRIFTEGLLFDDDALLESSGNYNASFVRRYDVITGKIFAEYKVPGKLFAEGLALINKQLIMLTYQERTGYVFDALTLAFKKSFHYNHDGWGATTNGNEFIVSDGTDIIRFYNPRKMTLNRSIRVMSHGKSIHNLNELEWIDGALWANVFGTNWIVIIDSINGQVTGWVDASNIPKPRNGQAVLNGIAYHPKSRSIYLTGKYYPKIYSISLVRGR